jgi:hypothetical protein
VTPQKKQLAEAIYRTEGLSIEEENLFKIATECCICKRELQADINKIRLEMTISPGNFMHGTARRGCDLWQFQMKLRFHHCDL